MKVACMLEQDTYKPGDLPPEGYLAWHEWAEVQRKAGIKQVQCGKCGLWRTPQELSGQTMHWTAQSRKGPVEQIAPVCSKCAAPNARIEPGLWLCNDGDDNPYRRTTHRVTFPLNQLLVGENERWYGPIPQDGEKS